jgi:hypothetical protein
MRTFWTPLVFAAFTGAALPAQTVRWNDIASAIGEEQDPPALTVWLERAIVPWGGNVRVNFRVEEDAYVVVARVDYTGALTVLYPSNRNRMYPVKAGVDHMVRSARLGALASFRANERPGSTGYVFALATRDPLNLTRLSNRDFSSWVTGISRSRPSATYIGDPYRVIQRFARLVMDGETPFEYDVQFYSVDQPQFAHSSFSGFCGLGYSPWSQMGFEYNDSGSLDADRTFNCRSPVSCFRTFLLQGIWLPFGVIPGYCPSYEGDQVTSADPVPPPFIPGQQGGPVNPWVADSIQRPNVGVQTSEGVKQEVPARPAPVATGDGEDLSFTIPARALRGFRDRNEQAGPGGKRGESGPVPMPARPVPTVADRGTPIEWVRPPRALDRPVRAYDIDRLPNRYASRSRDEMPSRGGGMRTFDPPPRSGSPMWDRAGGTNWDPPSRNYGGLNSGAGAGSIYTPPSSFDGRPMTNPGLTTSGSSGAGTTTTSTPPSSTASSGSSSTAEKKPHQ